MSRNSLWGNPSRNWQLQMLKKRVQRISKWFFPGCGRGHSNSAVSYTSLAGGAMSVMMSVGHGGGGGLQWTWVRNYSRDANSNDLVVCLHQRSIHSFKCFICSKCARSLWVGPMFFGNLIRPIRPIIRPIRTTNLELKLTLPSSPKAPSRKRKAVKSRLRMLNSTWSGYAHSHHHWINGTTAWRAPQATFVRLFKPFQVISGPSRWRRCKRRILQADEIQYRHFTDIVTMHRRIAANRGMLGPRCRQMVVRGKIVDIVFDAAWEAISKSMMRVDVDPKEMLKKKKSWRKGE